MWSGVVSVERATDSKLIVIPKNASHLRKSLAKSGVVMAIDAGRLRGTRLAAERSEPVAEQV
jgi:hypothetical protein